MQIVSYIRPVLIKIQKEQPFFIKVTNIKCYENPFRSSGVPVRVQTFLIGDLQRCLRA
jgi:hypothetical protein